RLTTEKSTRGLRLFVDLLARRGRRSAHVRKDKPAAVDDLAGERRDRTIEHRTLVGERVKLAVFAARVDAGGEITQQRALQLTSSERTVEMLRIDARHHRAQAAGDHFFR